MKVATPEEVQKSSDRNSPWGKPGAGAPLKETDGSIVKNTKGRMQHEALVRNFVHDLFGGLIRA